MIPTLIDGFEGVKTPVEEVTAEVVEITATKILELEVGLEDVTELLQSRDKTLTNEELLLMQVLRK